MNNETKIIRIASETIQIEAAAINALQDSINDDFVSCVNLIFNSVGRLIVTGIGKSALVAQKIVATLNSTGTPAIFMHAADAIHGDLGMIQKNDIVLCISKSGETPEIKVLVPLVKNAGNIVLAMISKKESYLGQQAAYILHTPIKEEADPNNLAPTASTTAQLAMGDALAMSLLGLRGFSSSDFAMIHPGGILGKQLYLKVSDLYPNNEKPSVLPTANIREVIIEITSKRLGMTTVIDETNVVKGIITDGDLRRMLEREEDSKLACASDIMTSNPKTIDKDAMAVSALTVMRKSSITQLIVVDGEKYMGVIHLHDIIREGLI